MNKMLLVMLLVLIAAVLLLAMLALGYSRNWGLSGEATPTPTSEFPTLGPLDATLEATAIPTATASRVPTNTPTFIPVFTTTPGYYPLTFISIAWDGMTEIGGRSTGRLTIDGNGNVSYEAENPIAHKTKRSVKLSPQQVEELVAAIRKANVFAMEDEYASSCCGFVPTTLSIMLNGRIKNIVHRRRVPMALDELERKIWGFVFPPPPTRTPTYHDLSIKMTESGGRGGYSYRFEIDGSGNVGFEALGSVRNPPKVRPKIGAQQVEALVAAIRKANVFELKDEYSGILHCLDCEWIALSITLNGQSKNILHYGDLECSGVGVDAAPVALCELERKINEIVILPPPTTTPYPSNATVLVTVYADANKDGTPQPSEGMGGIAVQLLLPDGKLLSALTSASGQVLFDMSGYETGMQLTVTLPELYRSYEFYLPQSGTVQIIFGFSR